MASYGYMAKIGADTSGLQAGLKDINNSLKATDNELYKVNKSIKTATQAGTDRSDLLKQKEDILKNAISETTQKLERLRSVEENVKNAANNGSISAEQYRDYQREIANTEAELRQYGNQLVQTQQAEQNSAGANQMVVTSLTDVQNAYQKVAQDLQWFTDKLKNVADAALTYSERMAKYSLTVGRAFESSMSQVKAYSGAVGEDFEKLETAAKNAGATTSKSAKEAADALGYMALAGWDTEEMLDGLMPIVRASEAGTADLKRTSDLVTDSMSAMGVATDDLSHYLDVCTAAQSNSNTTLTALLEAYVGCGGTLRNMNVPLEESAALLGTLANRGIKASEAGTSLNSILVNLMGANKSARDAMESLGVSAWDTQGNFIGVTETLRQLDGALKNCTEQEKAFLEAKIGGKTQMDTLQALIAGVRDEYDELYTTLENSQGALETTADTMHDNLAGAVTTMRSSLEALGVEFYDYLEEPAREAVEAVTEAIRKLTDSVDTGKLGEHLKDLSEKAGKLIEKLTEFAAEKGIPMLIDGLSELVDVLSWVADNFDLVTGAVKTFGAVFVTLKLAKTAADIQILITTISTLTATAEAGSVAAEVLGVALNSIKFTAIGSAAVGLAVAVASLYDAETEALRSTSAWRSEIEKNTQSLNDEREAMIASSEEIDKNTEKINKNYDKAKDLWEQLQDLCDEEGNVVGAYSDAQTVITELNELTGSHIELIGNQIAGYDGLCTSMDNYIETMRRTALLEATRDAYVDAVARKDELDEKAESARETEQQAKSKRENAEIRKNRDKFTLTSQLGIDIEELRRDPDYQQWAMSNEGKKYDIADINGYISFLKWQEGFASANRLAAEGAVKENEDILKKYEETATGTPDTQTASSKEPQKTSAQLDAEDNASKNQQAMREQAQKKKDAVLDQLQTLKDKHDKHRISDKDYYSQLGSLVNANRKLFENEDASKSDFWKIYDSEWESYKKSKNRKNSGGSGGTKETDPERLTSAAISKKKKELSHKAKMDKGYSEADRLGELEKWADEKLDHSTEAYADLIDEIAESRQALFDKEDEDKKKAAEQSVKDKIAGEKERLKKLVESGEINELQMWEKLEEYYGDKSNWEELERLSDEYASAGKDISKNKDTAGIKQAKSDYDELAGKYEKNLISEQQYRDELLNLKKEYAEKDIDISKYIAEEEGKINEKRVEKAKKAGEEQLDDIKKKYDDLENEIDKRASDLASGKLYEDTEISGGGTKKVFNDLSKKKEELKKYAEDIEKLRATNIPQELMGEILAMDYDDRKEVISELLKMTDAKRSLYYSDYTAYHAAAKEAAELEYSDEKAAVDEELMDYRNSALADAVDIANQYGKDAAQAYLDGWNEIYKKAGLSVLTGDFEPQKASLNTSEQSALAKNIGRESGLIAVDPSTPITINISGEKAIETCIGKILAWNRVTSGNNTNV